MQRLKYGMIGGGSGAFIGAVHRTALAMDGLAELAAGALSSTPERAAASAKELGLGADRAYGSWREMLEKELARPREDRIDFVVIVTPNDMHAEPAEAFARAGFHIVLDKPMTATVEEAQQLAGCIESSEVLFAVTYTYTGYPMVRTLARMVRGGEIGVIRKVMAEYHQGWLATDLAAAGQKQASWRGDPARAGLGGAIGDIGTHAENLVAYVTGLKLESLCADLTAFVPGRKVDDDAQVLLRFASGARGVLSASQVCIGEENNLTLRVYGDKGSLAWSQEHPNHATFMHQDGSTRILSRAASGDETSRGFARLPPGHPEGYFEAFANIYRDVCRAIAERKAGRSEQLAGGAAPHAVPLVPGVREGLRGVRFVRAVVESSRSGGVWVQTPEL